MLLSQLSTNLSPLPPNGPSSDQGNDYELQKLMHDSATAEVWQTALGKDVGGMAQGDNKTGQKGTDAIFVMTHDDIKHALQAGEKFTYCNPVDDHRPQKENLGYSI